MTNKPLIAWTIAGSDSGGGAGIQADLLTFHDFNVHGCSAITALTAQNSTAVTHVAVTSPENLRAQLEALASDLPARAIKLGMLADAPTIAVICDFLADFAGQVVCDPVMVTTTGAALLDGEGGRQLREQLLPRVDLLTPNLTEAEVLLGRAIHGSAEMQQAAVDLVAMGARSVLLKGGHDVDSPYSADIWTDGTQRVWLTTPRLDTMHTHGTGCTLSAAITAALARGEALEDALVLGKMYVTQGLRAARQLGAGPGPVTHRGFPRRLVDLPTLSTAAVVAERGETVPFADCGGPLGLYPVVDTADWIERLLPLGVTTIQLRNKTLQGDALAQEVARAVQLTRQFGARLFINDHWQLAIRHGAYGVHLGQEDLDQADPQAIHDAGLRLGVSTHSWAEIARAHALRPSYIAIGPIFPTTTKVMKFSERGVERLQQWVDLLKPDYTLTAIGGINRERAPRVLATGVESCALVTAITLAGDYRAETAALMALHQTTRS